MKGKKIKIEAVCKITGKTYSTDFIREDDFEKFKNGASIQECLDYISEDDREFLVSGISPKGWNMIYGYDDKNENFNEEGQNNQPFAD